MVVRRFTLKDNNYFDESCCKIRSITPGEENVRINIYRTNTRILQYYQENQKGERTSWKAPKAFAIKLIKQTQNTAEEKNRKVIKQTKHMVQERMQKKHMDLY